MDISETIAELELRGWTVSSIAAATGFTSQSVARWKRGQPALQRNAIAVSGLARKASPTEKASKKAKK